jgi:hypothetical protein
MPDVSNSPATREVMRCNLIHPRRACSAALDAISVILRECVRAKSTRGSTYANYKSADLEQLEVGGFADTRERRQCGRIDHFNVEAFMGPRRRRAHYESSTAVNYLFLFQPTLQ